VEFDIEFREFPKIARLSREIVITEKIDGTNAQIVIASTAELPPNIDVPEYCTVATLDGQSYVIAAGKRTDWCTPEKDHFGFAKGVWDNKDELVKLGPGAFFGEWWGAGIQRTYGLKEKHFSLFNVEKFGDPASRPSVCDVVPVLYRGPFDTEQVRLTLERLEYQGSVAAPGFPKPEGIIVFHKASGSLFKKTILKDEEPKTLHKQAA